MLGNSFERVKRDLTLPSEWWESDSPQIFSVNEFNKKFTIIFLEHFGRFFSIRLLIIRQNSHRSRVTASKLGHKFRTISLVGVVVDTMYQLLLMSNMHTAANITLRPERNYIYKKKANHTAPEMQFGLNKHRVRLNIVVLYRRYFPYAEK